jgi:anti-sigma regulatory factor (Ser/Thr protein kinase)
MNTLKAELKLLAVPTAVRCAREFTTQMLERWRLADLVDTACLVVSELVTNAVQATGTLELEPDDATLTSLPLVELHLSIRSDVLLIEVGDTSTTPPGLQQQYEAAENGRGLFLVAMLSKEWSFYLSPGGGKVVWAAVELRRSGEWMFATDGGGPLPRRTPGTALSVVAGHTEAMADVAQLERVLWGLQRL